MPLIQVEHLRKEFKRQKRKDGFWPLMKSLVYREYEQKVAVEDISFTIDQGEIVGYIGPNGAGKSTTIKMMVGILVPTGGEVRVNGLIPFENRIQNARRIGAVFGQKSQLWWDTPVIESLRLTKYMYDIPEDRYVQNMALFSDILGLDEFKNVAVRSLSLGQRMRADLCAALLHDPQIVYLDEPTIGLDVVVKERIREFIRQINRERGTTVILTTHDMADIEKLCSRVMVVDHGRLMYDGNLHTLKNDYGNMETMELDTEEEFVMDDALVRMGISFSRTEDARTQLLYDKNSINSSAVIKWIMERYSVRDFKVKETEIEEIIRNLYAGFSQTEPARQEVMV